MSCCTTPDIREVDSLEMCFNCHSLYSDVTFEESREYFRSPPSLRKKKFEELLLSKDLPWHLTRSLLDLFIKIEIFFEEGDRKNFINLEHLCHSILKTIGYPEESDKFTCLKTKSRSRLVDEFVRDMFKSFGRDNVGGMELKDVPSRKCVASPPDIWMDKVVSEHLYTDGSEKCIVYNAKEVKTETKVRKSRAKKVTNKDVKV